MASACRSASNRASTLLESMPGLMSFKATLRLDRLELLGDPDLAHAALGDAFQELVAAGDHAGGGVCRLGPGRRFVVHRAGSRSEDALGLGVRRQEGFNPLPQGRIAGTFAIQQARPVGRIESARRR